MKKYFTLFHFLFLLKVQAQTLYFPPKTGTSWDTLSPNRLGWCDARIDSLYSYLGNTNSKAFIILKDGKIVLEKYFETFTQDSIHYWASAGKSLTATMIGIAQRKGLLNINDSVSKYLGVGWTSAGTKEKFITIKNLLCMDSGLDDEPAFPCDNMSQEPSCLQYKADAGTRWSYHTGAYRKLEDVVTAVSGQGYTAATNSYIGSKTGMSGIWLNSVFFSRTRDMACFGLLTLNKGIWQSDTVLRDTSYFRAMTNTSQNINKSYGYLWWLNGKPSFMLPQSQAVIPFKFIPSAPDDMFCAMGKNDQRIYVVPSQNIVVVRVGESAYNSLAWSPYDTILWTYISNLSNGCMLTSVAQKKVVPDLKLFPNPVNNFISFNGFSGNGIIRYSIINLNGQTIVENETHNHSINVSELEAGQYILTLQDDEQQATKQFIKN